jgi:antitoxin MazE
MYKRLGGVITMQEVKLSKWGNSKGIRIPKPILDVLGFSDDEPLEIEVVEGKLIVSKKELRACGILSHLANPSLIEEEEGVWEREVFRQYEID